MGEDLCRWLLLARDQRPLTRRPDLIAVDVLGLNDRHQVTDGKAAACADNENPVRAQPRGQSDLGDLRQRDAVDVGHFGQAERAGVQTAARSVRRQDRG